MDELTKEEFFAKAKADLFGGLPYFFLPEVENEILQRFRQQLEDKIQQGRNKSDAWREVVTSFHRQQHWGFPVISKKPKIEDSDDTKNAKEAFSYLWTAVQATLILKVVIYFFGLKLAQDNTPENWTYFLSSLSFSWGSLFFFAWRKHKKKTWENSEPK